MSENLNIIELTADVVSSHLSNNSVAVGDVPTLIRQVHQALAGLENPEPAAEQNAERSPVVSVRASIKPDYLVCLECGAKQKTLKRHIQNAHGYTPAEYREAYSLKPDYPMVAPAYSERRSEMAKSIGLGQKGRAARGSDAGQKPEATPKKARGRRRKEPAAEG